MAAARAAGYVNAGTIEFVLAPDGQFYFIEMNTRIQVEHPVTELVTGLDLVREQIRVSAGLPLSVTQEEVLFRGHAIECRINAEDPAKGFQPCPGRIDFLHLPGGYGVRVDTGLYTGYELPPYYDSLMAKLIVYAPTRLEAIRRMRRALEELVIEGPATNTDLLHQILHHPDFVRGNYSTGFLEAHMDTLLAWSGSGRCVRYEQRPLHSAARSSSPSRPCGVPPPLRPTPRRPAPPAARRYPPGAGGPPLCLAPCAGTTTPWGPITA